MKNMRSSMLLTALIAVCLFTMPAAGGAAPLATVSISPLGLHWQASGDFEKIVLTVAGPDGLVLRREFAAGVSPVFELFGNDGKPLADGSYTWEMTAAPKIDRETRRAMAAARRAGDEAAIARLREAGKLPKAPLTQSGVFAISNGAAVSPDLREEQLTKDQVIPDDLIVQGSACVGLDCVNNENFGFDTIRLKENNLRIHFDDTSTQAGFPANDWRLIANDSASGGSSKFSIEDSTGAKTPFTITAGATTNSIFVNSTGRVGFRTSTPVLDLHVNTSNTPAIRLEQNNSGGFTAQTWDIAGNEANFFVRDVTGGSKLSFRIRPGAPTSSIDIASDGEVGIGTASPVAELTVKSDVGNSDVFVVQGSDISSPTIFRVFETTAGDGLFSVFNELDQEAGRFTAVSGGRFSVGCNAPEHDIDLGNAPGTACNAAGSRSFIDAGSTTFTASSSRFIKENLKPVEVPNILDKISQVGVYNYDFIDGPKDKIGVMAEDFHTIFAKGSDKLLNGQDVEMALWLAVQELTAQNKELTKRLADLETRLTATQGGNTP